MKKVVNKKEETDKDLGLITTSVVALLLILGLWILTYYQLKDLDNTKRGTFGDMFGALNALFSGLAFAGIILTILLQRKELKLQRQELQETREEFRTQNETLKLQRFENTFFSLLNLHHQIVNAIDFRYYKRKESSVRNMMDAILNDNEEKEIVVITGRDVFRYRYNSMLEELKSNFVNWEEQYFKEYQEAQTDFGHYFRNLYRMIKLVDQTSFFYDEKEVSEVEVFELKYKYTSIIRSQISDYELLWIFYNCASRNGKEKFRPLIERYSFLKNLPRNLLASEIHIKLYEPRAYDPKTIV